jgi:hypothetical protein
MPMRRTAGRVTPWRQREANAKALADIKAEWNRMLSAVLKTIEGRA